MPPKKEARTLVNITLAFGGQRARRPGRLHFVWTVLLPLPLPLLAPRIVLRSTGEEEGGG